MTFSAWSLALAMRSPASAAVPLMGRVSTAVPSHERNRSGDAPTTATGPWGPGSRRMVAWGGTGAEPEVAAATDPFRTAAVRATGSVATSHTRTRVRFTW